MKPRLAIIFLLLVSTPLALLAWLGVKASENEERRVEERFREVFDGQLSDTEDQIGRVVGEAERSLYAASASADGVGPDELRALVRRQRLVRQVFIRSAGGEFIHPPAGERRTAQEEEFFDRTRSIWSSGVVFGQGGANWQVDLEVQAQYKVAPDPVAQASQKVLLPPSDPATGWYGWFWGDGLNWIFWRQPYPGGDTIGIEVDRVAFISDVIEALPNGSAIAGGRAVLSDARGEPIYEWGELEPAKDAKPIAERALGVPLAGWRLLYHARAPAGMGSSAKLGLFGGLAGVGIALLGLAVYFYRENAREVREAGQKVSFVNQVSHELKTPLTNIRMYAELAEAKLGPEAEPSLRKCIGVVSDESGRLSRLITNVLTFAKRDRGPGIHRSGGEVDEVIASTVEHFRPALEQAGVEIRLDLDAAGRCAIDPDALEQILANLFSNVEKYAASGGLLAVESRRRNSTVEIAVEDRGPGIPKSARGRIFEPFARLSDKVTEGASGTGIGLSIARDLARQMGGNLHSENAADGDGARFVLSLEAADC